MIFSKARENKHVAVCEVVSAEPAEGMRIIKNIESVSVRNIPKIIMEYLLNYIYYYFFFIINFNNEHQSWS
jgi:hypothetical protein